MKLVDPRPFVEIKDAYEYGISGEGARPNTPPFDKAMLRYEYAPFYPPTRPGQEPRYMFSERETVLLLLSEQIVASLWMYPHEWICVVPPFATEAYRSIQRMSNHSFPPFDDDNDKTSLRLLFLLFRDTPDEPRVEHRPEIPEDSTEAPRS